MDGAHALARGFKGQLAQARQLLGGVGVLHAAFRGRDEQRGFRRVAQDGPAFAFAWRDELGVVAQRCADEQFVEISLIVVCAGCENNSPVGSNPPLTVR
jgi:hypothetical protein